MILLYVSEVNTRHNLHRYKSRIDCINSLTRQQFLHDLSLSTRFGTEKEKKEQIELIEKHKYLTNIRREEWVTYNFF